VGCGKVADFVVDASVFSTGWVLGIIRERGSYVVFYAEVEGFGRGGDWTDVFDRSEVGFVQ
jgi:hypothetical protein